MGKLIASILIPISLSLAHPFHGEEEFTPKRHHHSQGMGMMHMMMMDEEIRKIVKEHMKRCKESLMRKLMKKRREKMVEMFLTMMLEDPEHFKNLLKRNPHLREKLRGILKEVE